MDQATIHIPFRDDYNGRPCVFHYPGYTYLRTHPVYVGLTPFYKMKPKYYGRSYVYHPLKANYLADLTPPIIYLYDDLDMLLGDRLHEILRNLPTQNPLEMTVCGLHIQIRRRSSTYIREKLDQFVYRFNRGSRKYHGYITILGDKGQVQHLYTIGVRGDIDFEEVHKQPYSWVGMGLFQSIPLSKRYVYTSDFNYHKSLIEDKGMAQIRGGVVTGNPDYGVRIYTAKSTSS